MMFKYVTLAGLVALAACEPTANNGLGSVGGTSVTGGAVPVATPVALQTSGQDSCGAIDYKFLEGGSLANTFDLQMPANTRYLGRTMKADATNASRLTIVVSTRSPQMALYTPGATVRRVYCG